MRQRTQRTQRTGIALVTALGLLLAGTTTPTPSAAKSRSGWLVPAGIGLAVGLAIAGGGRRAQATTPTPVARTHAPHPMDHAVAVTGRVRVDRNDPYPRDGRQELVRLTVILTEHASGRSGTLRIGCRRDGGMSVRLDAAGGWPAGDYPATMTLEGLGDGPDLELRKAYGHSDDGTEGTTPGHETIAHLTGGWPAGQRAPRRKTRIEPRHQLLRTHLAPGQRGAWHVEQSHRECDDCTPRTERWSLFEPTPAEAEARARFGPLCHRHQRVDRLTAKASQRLQRLGRLDRYDPSATPATPSRNHASLTDALLALHEVAGRGRRPAATLHRTDGDFRALTAGVEPAIERALTARWRDESEALRQWTARQERALAEWLRPRLQAELATDALGPNRSRDGGTLIRLAHQLTAELAASDRASPPWSWERIWETLRGTPGPAPTLRTDNADLRIIRTADTERVHDIRRRDRNSGATANLADALAAMGW